MIDTYQLPPDAATIDNCRQASGYLLAAAKARHFRERQLCRPSVVLAAELTSYISGVTGRTRYTASYGCVYAGGDTPEEAYSNFDRAWQGIDE